jgi:Protein of unknown function (DUF2911)
VSRAESLLRARILARGEPCDLKIIRFIVILISGDHKMLKLYIVIVTAVLFCAAACVSNGNRNNAPGNSNSSSSNSNNSNIGAVQAPTGGAQTASDRGEAVLQMEGGKVSVEYGRPSLRGRDVEKLIEPGQEWRMGSNDATTLATDVDLAFGDKVIPKGKYVLKAKALDRQEWVMLVQREEQTIAEIPLKFEKVDAAADPLTIELGGDSTKGKLSLHWGQLRLSTDFRKA